MEFGQPYYLFFLLLPPILILWYYKKGQHQEATVRFSNLDLIPNSVIRNGKMKNMVLILGRLAIISLIILALSRPRLSDTIRETKTEIIDILLVIDQSSSMLAQDFKPNRLEAAKDVAKTFIKDREGDRLGIIVFAGESYIQCPLTRDIDVLLEFTDEIKIIDREHDGTAIGMAIANSINRLRESEAKSKTIILLSDGSNNAGELDPTTAADLASQFDIKVYTIGAATDQSLAYIPGVGRMVNEIDEETLKAIAKTTGGRYFRARDKDMLTEIYQQINDMERTEIEVKSYTRYEELFGWLLIPALMLGMGTETLTRSIFRQQT